MRRRAFSRLVRRHLPFQDTNENAEAYVNAMIAAVQEALLTKGRLALDGVGTFETIKTVLGARVVYRPSPAIRQIAEEHNEHQKSGH